MDLDGGQLLIPGRGKLYWLLVNNVLKFVSVPLDCQCNNCRMVVIFNRTFPCGHVFCLDCYELLVSESRGCRRCLRSADSQIRHDKDLDKRIWKLETYCCYMGCRKVVLLENFLDHLKRCDKTDREHLNQLMQPHLDSEPPISPDFDIKWKVRNWSCYVWEISGYSKRKKPKERLSSEHFKSFEYGCLMYLEAYFLESALGVMLYFDDSTRNRWDEDEKYEPPEPSTVSYRTTLSILDQSDRKWRRDIVRVNELRFRKLNDSTELVFEMFDYSTLEHLSHHTYLKRDKIYVKVLVEPVEKLWRNPSISHDGVLLWKVSNYRRTKLESLERICSKLSSDSFYTSSRGYRMQCLLQFDDRHETVTIWSFFLHGEFDDKLPEVFWHKITVSILDQVGGNHWWVEKKLDPNETSVEHAKREMSANFCHLANFLCSKFETSPYLVNDTIVIKVVVEAITTETPE